MSKKLITGCLGLLALAAFMLPAAASASPVITHPTGTRLDPKTGECTGVKETRCITGTSVGTLLMTGDSKDEPGKSPILVECSVATTTGYLTKNTGTEMEGTIHTATYSGTGGVGTGGMKECTGSFGNVTVTSNGAGTDGENVENGTPWCIRATNEMKPDEFQVRGNSCSGLARPITFILHSTTIGECKYKREGVIPGTFTTHSTGDAIFTITSVEFKKEAGSILCPGTGWLDQSFTLETDSVSTEPLYIS